MVCSLTCHLLLPRIHMAPLLAVAALLLLARAVDRGNFKTCSDSSFCKRNRDFPVRRWSAQILA